MSINLFEILPTTQVHDIVLADNLRSSETLYILNSVCRLSLLDLIRFRKLQYPQGIPYGAGRTPSGALGIDILKYTNDRYKPTRRPTPANLDNIGDLKVTQVSAGSSHSLFLCENGTVYGCGNGSDGSLGDGNTNSHRVDIPVRINFPWSTDTSESDKYITYVCAGHDCSLFVCNDGSVYGCGDNGFGQLGTDTGGISDTVDTPTIIDNQLMGSEKRVVKVSSSLFHTLFLCDDGTVYGCGSSEHGVLGNGYFDDYEVDIPTQITFPNSQDSQENDSKIIQVVASDHHSLFLYDDGTIYACGYAEYGSLGIGPITNVTNPINDYNISIPRRVDTSTIKGKKVIQISANSWLSLFLCDDGIVYYSGVYPHRYNVSNSYQKAMLPTPIFDDTVNINGKNVQVSAGKNYILLLCNDGTAYGFGDNTCGVLGIGKRKRFINKLKRINTKYIGDKKIIQVSANLYHSLFLT